MFEDFINALRSFRLNKTRSFLSLLGVIIGVASVILITTLGQSATSSMLDSFDGMGMDIIELYDGQNWNAGGGGSLLNKNEPFRRKLWENIEGLKKIYYINDFNPVFRYDAIETEVATRAIENGYLEGFDAELESGRYFTISEYANGSHKIILGAEIAENIFPDGDAVGSIIRMNAYGSFYGFEVIGVLKEKQTMYERFDNNAYVPRGFFTKKIQPNPQNHALIMVKNQNDTSAISIKIDEYFTKITGFENVAYLHVLTSFIEQIEQMLGIMTILLSSIATISLLVGGIGIMNIMIVTVTERKKEIGIRKALGATPFAIRSQFLIESATITLLGGILGIIWGIILSAALIQVLNILQPMEGVKWVFELQWNSVGLAFIFSVFIGIFFGYAPAASASKLDPVEALANE